MGIHSRRNSYKNGTGAEHFAGQPETERYLNHVADKFDLRRDIPVQHPGQRGKL